MAKVPSIPPEAFFNTIAYATERHPSYFSDGDWDNPIRGQDQLNKIYTRASEGFVVNQDEDTDPGLGAGNMLGGRTYVDEGALRTDPATPENWDKLKSGK